MSAGIPKQPQRRWLADYRVESELVLKPSENKLVYVHPQNHFEVHISNAAEKVGRETLSVQIIVLAPDINNAEQVAQEHLEKFFHMMSFITRTPYRISTRVHLTDWTAGLLQREQYVYTKHPPEGPVEALSPSLLSTANLLHTWDTSPVLERALRWFATAVRAQVVEDQFQFFWFVVELLAISARNVEKVTDKCQKCRGDLYCSACGELSMHRPFQRQSIEMLLSSVGLQEPIIEDLFGVRNALMHGEARDVIVNRIQVKQPAFTLDKAVDILGNVAWTLILNAFGKTPGVHSPEFLQVSTFVDWRINAKAHLIITLSGDKDDPQIEDVLLPQVSIQLMERKLTP